EREIAEGRPVDDVHRHTSAARRRGELCRRLVVRAIGHGNCRAGEIALCPTALMKSNGVAGRRGSERNHVVAWKRGENINTRACGGKKLHLPGSRIAVASNDDALALQCEESRQPR